MQRMPVILFLYKELLHPTPLPPGIQWLTRLSCTKHSLIMDYFSCLFYTLQHNVSSSYCGYESCFARHGISEILMQCLSRALGVGKLGQNVPPKFEKKEIIFGN